MTKGPKRHDERALADEEATTSADARTGTTATEGRDDRGRGLITAELEEPIPLLGRRAQHLGFVRKLTLSLGDPSIRQLELRTPWQTLQLHGAMAIFDERCGVFRLQRRDRSEGRGESAQSPSSPPSSPPSSAS